MGTMDHPCVEGTLPTDWRYLSEGGATIVFSYVGKPHRHFSGMVLRLRKKALGPSPFSNGKHPDEPDPQIAFQHEIVSQLVPTTLLPKLMNVHVGRNWLKAFALAHDEERPRRRREVDGIDLTRTKAILATDLVGGADVLGVEIKPKWSFLPNTAFLSPRSKEIALRTCRFCMHTHMRQTLQDAPPRISYCPLDLFSETRERVTHAIESLWDTWESTGGTLNNFKIFFDGSLVTPENKKLLMTVVPINGNTPETHLIKKSLIPTIVEALLETPALHILNKLQRTLDVLDIEGLRKLWDLSGRTRKMGDGEPQPDIEEWKSFVDTYRKKSEYRPLQLNAADLRYFMLAYLLSATFKDCSIIIRRCGPLDLVAEADNPSIKTTVAIIDLDPKAIDRLAKWEKLNQKILTSYAQIKEEDRKICIDSWSSR